jgi:hypothetical protein
MPTCRDAPCGHPVVGSGVGGGRNWLIPLAYLPILLYTIHSARLLAAYRTAGLLLRASSASSRSRYTG